MELKELKDKSTIIAEDFKGPLSVTDGQIGQGDRKSVRIQKT